MRLKTRRLLLRPPVKGDAAHIFTYASLEEVSRPAGYPRHAALADSMTWVRTATRNWKKKGDRSMAFTILLKKDGTPIGGLNLRWSHPGVAVFGYGLHPDHWGRGYAPEAARKIVDLAFAKFGAHRVQATCWVKNTRSAAVLRKLGLRKEGRLRGYLKRAGEVRDEFIFGMTRQDWLAK
jgi:RimJ/RimL family protein N-acetyltransferase